MESELYWYMYFGGYVFTVVVMIVSIRITERQNLNFTSVNADQKVAYSFIMAIAWPALWVYWVTCLLYLLFKKLMHVAYRRRVLRNAAKALGRDYVG